MKNITKSFYISFILSLFAVFIADKFVFLPTAPTEPEIKLPHKNIALFVAKTSMRLPPQTTKKIAENKLHSIAKQEEITLFDQKEVDDILSPLEDENNALAEAQMIPIEKGTKLATASISHPEGIISPPVKKNFEIDVQKVSESDLKKEIKQNYAQKVSDSEQSAKQTLSAPENESIPIENGKAMLSKSKIEIMEKAPKSQVATIGKIGSAGNGSAIKAVQEEKTEEPKEWTSMEDTPEDNPWVVAKANQYPKNNKATEDFSVQKSEEEISALLEPSKVEGEESLRTAKIMKNILIPIPEDIMNDENLEPQLVSSKKKSDKSQDSEESAEETSPKKRSLLKNITSFFSGSSDKDEEDADSGNKDNSKKNKYSKTKSKAVPKILPAEMKLSFQPGRAQISGQTLRWVQAFALKATEDPDVILEIRIDKNSSYALQQRRLELLHTILGSKGIDENKVNTVFTSREPNSFIIRTLRLSEETQNFSKNNKKGPAIYQTW